MNITPIRGVVAAAALASLTLPNHAHAHAIAGDRTFPVTLTMDDPGVADEASIPTFSVQRQGADGGPGPVYNYNLGIEYDKRITENFGLAVNWGGAAQQTLHGSTQYGWQNLFVTAKGRAYMNPEHEFILSVGVQRELSHVGTTQLGADTYGSTTPLVYIGKGMGDLPWDYVRPFAVTGEFGYTIADVGLKGTTTFDPGTGQPSTSFNAGNENRYSGGVSIQYSLPYLQAQVRDLGLGPVFGRMIPLVEFTWSSPATAPSGLGTTWQAAPGVIWLGSTWQFGIEALIPLNKTTGTNVGVIAQFHIFLDDLLPNSLGKPLLEW